MVKEHGGKIKMSQKRILIPVTVEGLDDAISKAEKYTKLLKEAKTLANELASIDFKIESH